MLDHALSYAARGWLVFPVAPKAKVPLTTHGVKDASSDPATIAAWWARWPSANIAIATGDGSGISVVDLDASDAKDGKAEWAKLQDAYGQIRTVASVTGSGGRHLFFKHRPGFKNSQGKIAPGIDTRGDGGYVVAPPSIHPNGNAYEWLIPPEMLELEEMPAWVNLEHSGNLAGKISDPGPRISIDAPERCRRYLETIPEAISGNKGHANTLRAAAECFRFGLAESEAWDLLSWFNTHKCQPAWSEKELRHKLKEGRKLVDKEGKFGAKLDEGDTAAEWAPTTPLTTPAETPPTPATATLPPELLSPPGIVGDICRWINATAIKPQPILALANAMAFWGAVVGQKVRTATDLRSNLYCLGVGESGCGKDHSRKAIKRICEAAGHTADVLGGEEISSDSGLLAAVAAHPSILFQLDEIGHMLSQVNSKYAATHQRNIAPTFTKLFSSANTTFIGKEYSGRDRADIREPNVCLYGTTVGSRLFEGLTLGDIADGFLPRMLVFVSDTPDPADCIPGLSDVPAGIVENVKWWRARLDLPRAHSGNMAPAVPFTYEFDDEAARIMADFAERCRGHKATRRDGSGIDALWTRALEHARKVALIMASGDQVQTPVISQTVAAWSVRLVEHLVKGLANAIGDNVSGSEHGRTVNKILRIIRERGPVTKNLLTRATQDLTRRQRDEAIEQLIETGRLSVTDYIRDTGRPGRTFRATGD